eukprot:193134-Pelagomonas_calceolata.AAC.1
MGSTQHQAQPFHMLPRFIIPGAASALRPRIVAHSPLSSQMFLEKAGSKDSLRPPSSSTVTYFAILKRMQLK